MSFFKSHWSYHTTLCWMQWIIEFTECLPEVEAPKSVMQDAGPHLCKHTEQLYPIKVCVLEVEAMGTWKDAGLAGVVAVACSRIINFSFPVVSIALFILKFSTTFTFPIRPAFYRPYQRTVCDIHPLRGMRYNRALVVANKSSKPVAEIVLPQEVFATTSSRPNSISFPSDSCRKTWTLPPTQNPIWNCCRSTTHPHHLRQ